MRYKFQRNYFADEIKMKDLMEIILFHTDLLAERDVRP